MSALPSGPAAAAPISADEVRRRMKEGRLKREELAAAEAKRQKEKQDAAAAASSSVMTTKDYIVNGLIAAFFMILPLGEPTIDWYHVGAVVALNVIWNLFLHENTWLHVGLLVVMNVVLIQLTMVWHNIPGALAQVPPFYLYSFAGGNVVVIALGYLFYIRKQEDRYAAWDIFLVCVMLGNLVLLIALGVVPMSAVYMMFKGVTGLLSNFQVG